MSRPTISLPIFRKRWSPRGTAEIIADNLKKAGWSYGYVSALDSHGRTIWIADAHRDGKRFVVHADEKLTSFVELEAGSLTTEVSITFALAFQLLADFHISQTAASERLITLFAPGVEVESCRDGRYGAQSESNKLLAELKRRNVYRAAVATESLPGLHSLRRKSFRFLKFRIPQCFVVIAFAVGFNCDATLLALRIDPGGIGTATSTLSGVLADESHGFAE
jgi:hypothetical protein